MRMSRKTSSVFTIAIVASTLTSATLAAEPNASLYRTVTIVTGQREETRTPGIQRCFTDVLIKVSGDQTLATSSVVLTLLSEASTFVTDYTYHDRLWRRPIHDEQGTRDRPHDLTVTFDRQKIDAVLRSVGRSPWATERPVIVAFVAVQQGDLSYLTSTDGPHGYGQADAFLDAAASTGITSIVPDQNALTAARLTPDQVRATDPDHLRSQAVALGGTAALVGTMRFSDADLGWVVDWRFSWRGITHRWHVNGVNFDAAFRDGMRGVAQIASAHGAPPN